MTTETKTMPNTGQGTGNPNLRHFVQQTDGVPADTALCGYIWDRLHVQHNGEMCQECVDLSKKIPRA